MKKVLSVLALLTALAGGIKAQKVKDFRPALDSMQVLMKKRTTVSVALSAKKITARGSTLDFHFTNTLGDYPWRSADVRWFKSRLKSNLPNNWKDYSVGDIYVGTNKLESYVMPSVDGSGKPVSHMFRAKDRKGQSRFIRQVGSEEYGKGLSGRTIALWQSHGRYYEGKMQRWEWQRAPLFQTVEDM